MSAKKIINQFSYLELIEFEDDDSLWLNLFEGPLKQFRQIDSKPTYIKPIGDNKNSYISWFENSLAFLKEKKEWIILVPNCPRPIWANVRVLNFTKGIEELWEKSKFHDFIIANKSTGNIVQIFSEEKNYEIHIGECDFTKNKNN
ncbi:hypothetical protein [Fictibacillus gelatini]|uniref:hypothetical protein n=1 Tax=Fictibacillus gelatini TaxID=225985 RepID=UPI00041CBC40|nr:hypothetical protein [Fictibacillus gelatini]